MKTNTAEQSNLVHIPCSYSSILIPRDKQESAKLTNQEAIEVIDSFKEKCYPRVEVTYLEGVSTRNAKIIYDRSSDKGYITLDGGLARFHSIGRDGLILVLLHEIGHIYGEREFNYDYACEHVADVWSTKLGAKAYYEPVDTAKILRGIDELFELHKYYDSIPNYHTGCWLHGKSDERRRLLLEGYNELEF